MPSDFASGAPDSAFWFVELPDGVVRTTWRGYELTRAVQAASGMTAQEADGAWGPRTLQALRDALLWSSNANGVRYLGDVPTQAAGVTPQVLQAAIWLLEFGRSRDIPYGRIKVPSDSVMPPWGHALPHTPPDTRNVDTPTGGPMRPYDATDTSVPTPVLEHAAQTGTAPSPQAATPTASQPQVPAVRPLGLPSAPAPQRPTGISTGAVVGVIAAVVLLGAVAVSLSQPPRAGRAQSTKRARARRR